MNGKEFTAKQDALKAWVIQRGGEWRLSHRSVPYALFPYRDSKASVCYFRKTNIYRLFYPFAQDNQEKWDFNSIEELEAFAK